MLHVEMDEGAFLRGRGLWPMDSCKRHNEGMRPSLPALLFQSGQGDTPPISQTQRAEREYRKRGNPIRMSIMSQQMAMHQSCDRERERDQLIANCGRHALT